jgi:hypothetical protein
MNCFDPARLQLLPIPAFLLPLLVGAALSAGTAHAVDKQEGPFFAGLGDLDGGSFSSVVMGLPQTARLRWA